MMANMPRVSTTLLSFGLLLTGCSTSAAPIPSSTTPALTPTPAAVCEDSYAFNEESEVTANHIDKFVYEINDFEPSEELELKPGENKITSAGSYLVSGDYEDTWINVNSTGNGEVILILDNLNIANSDSPAISFENAAQAHIVVATGSKNSLSSATPFSETATAQHTITAKTNLLIAGDGLLEVKSANYDAINTNDGLIVDSARLELRAGDDGLVGSEYLQIKNSEISIESADDAIRTTNDSADNFGLLEVIDSVVEIVAGDEGIQSRTDLLLRDSEIKIRSAGHGIRANCRIGLDANIQVSTELIAAKADKGLSIFGGKFNVTKSYEGLESFATRIFGGKISITSSDDGISTRIPEGYRDYNLAQTENFDFVMTGGEVRIISQMDAVDSNGNVLIQGGLLIATSTEDNVENAIDSEHFFFNDGGEIWGISNADGQLPAHEDSEAPSLISYFDEMFPVGAAIEIRTAGIVISKTESLSKFKTVLYSSQKLQPKKEYEIWISGRLKAKVKAGVERGKQPGYNRVNR